MSPSPSRPAPARRGPDRRPRRRHLGLPLLALSLALAVAGQSLVRAPGQAPSVVVLYSQSTSAQAAKSPLARPLPPPPPPPQSPRPNIITAAPRPAVPAAPAAPPAASAPIKHGAAAAAAAPGAVPGDVMAAPQTPVRAGDVLPRGRSPPPRCAGSQPFCLYDQDYPQERVHDILNTYNDDAQTLYHALHRYNPQDLINRDNQTHNYRHRGHFACESEVAYLRPGWAKNWKDQWMAVVNTDKYPQMVRVETCKYLGQKCEFLAPCYKSSCVQRFAASRLLCVDPANPHQRPVIDVFEMPVACSCFVENFRFI